MANLKDRLLSKIRSFKGEQESDEDHHDGSTQEQPTQDSLSRLGVAIQTSIPDAVMSSREIKTLRFGRAAPGYDYDEVESAVSDFIKTISWHEGTLHQRDLDVHKLASVNDELEAALTNKNYQLESLSVTGSSLLVDENQQPLSPESMEARLAVALESEQTLREALESSSKLVSDAKNYTGYQAQQITELEQRISAYESGAEVTTPQIESGVAVEGLLEGTAEEVEALRAELEEKTHALAMVESERAVLQSENAQLNENLISATAVSVPVASASGDGEEADGGNLAEDYAALQQWAEAVVPQYEESVTKAASLESDIAELTDKLDKSVAYSTELEAFAAESDKYIDELLTTADAAVAAQGEAVEVATRYMEDPTAESAAPTHGTLDSMDAEDITAPERAVEPTYEPEPASSERELAPTSSTSPHEGSEEDVFAAALQDLAKPEVSQEDFSRLRLSRPTMDYVKSKPGAPLSSLRPGENTDDIL